MVKNINGYSVATKLLFYSYGYPGLKHDFATTCKLFGPFWDKMSPIERSYFKKLATNYKKTPLGKQEKKGLRPSKGRFLQVLFENNKEEQDMCLKELYNVAQEINNCDDDESDSDCDTIKFDSEYEYWLLF